MFVSSANPSMMMISLLCGLLVCLSLLSPETGVMAQTAVEQGDESRVHYIAIIEFKGRPNSLDADQIATLEANFVDVYNYLEETALEDNIPPFIRRLTKATIDPQSLTDVESLQRDDGTVMFELVCRVDFACYGCKEDFRLFSNETKPGMFYFSFDPWFGPTPELFLFFFSNAIRSDAALSASIDDVLEVQQLENQECTPDVSTFETASIVTFVGDPNEASLEEFRALATGFQNAYNGLNGIGSNNCDLQFRQVTDVTIELTEESRQRQLQWGLSFNFTQISFSYIFRIVFQCRNCGFLGTLFENDASRMLSSINMQMESHRFLQAPLTVDTECACLLDSQEFRGPTAAEFSIRYNETVRDLTIDGAVDFIAAVSDVMEFTPVACSSVIEQASVDISIDVLGYPSSLTASNITGLERFIVSSYNDLAEGSCDNLFRKTMVASLLETIVPDSDDELKSFTMIFQVFFTCRGQGCASTIDLGIFGADTIRRLNDDPRQRRLQGTDGDTCFCPSNTDRFDAPSASDFTTAFGGAIKTSLDTFPSIVFVSGVTDSICPQYYQNCDVTYANGCEANIWNGDDDNCGVCGNVCPTGQLCVNGRCGCDKANLEVFTTNGRPDNYPAMLTMEDGCGLRLTPDNATRRASSAFMPMTMKNDNFMFSMHMAYRMFGEAYGTADGIAFVIHQDSKGVGALGSPGGALGYIGIRRAIAVEMDTYPNANLNDENFNHLHIQQTLANSTVVELMESPPRDVRTVTADVLGGLWVDYDGTTLRVYHDVQSDKIKPDAPALEVEVSLADIFENNPEVFVGFTSGTLQQADNQDIVAWSMTQ